MQGRSPTFYVQVGLLGFVLVGAILLAVPRLAAEAPLATAMISTPEAMDRATPEQVERAVSAAEWAVTLQPGSRENHRDLSSMRLLNVEVNASGLDDAQRQEKLSLARQALRDGLAQGPSAPDMWFTLARMRSLGSAPDAQTISFIRNSYLTGPRENWIGTQRLGYVLAWWDQFDPALQAMIQRGLRDQTAQTLAQLVLGRSPAVTEIIEREIATRPEPVRNAFERARKRIDKGVL